MEYRFWAARPVTNDRNLVADSVPLTVGFGISKPDHVRRMIHAGADGANVGSAFV
jgi:tryptophan synthase alpha subunit